MGEGVGSGRGDSLPNIPGRWENRDELRGGGGYRGDGVGEAREFGNVRAGDRELPGICWNQGFPGAGAVPEQGSGDWECRGFLGVWCIQGIRDSLGIRKDDPSAGSPG